MSLKYDINKLPNEQIEKINKDLLIKLENNKYAAGAPTKYIYSYLINNDDVYLPFNYASTVLNLKRTPRNQFSSMNVFFTGILRPEQKVVKDEAIAILNKTGSVIISAYTGFGKTLSSINLACTIKLKTLIIVNKIVLITQWEESILKFCPKATVQKLTTKSKLKDCDFYIMNAINIEKMGKTFFKDMGLIIVDESHLIMAETLSKSLQYLNPRYLIGLSATPYRLDGLDILLELYFGKNKIVREMNRKHIVYQVNTGFEPTVEFSENGKVVWGSILKSQSEDEKRNELIINIVRSFSDRNFLVLTKRVEQGKLIFDKLQEYGENVTSLIGKQQTFDAGARILVGTTSKCATGFDHPKLDAMILCSDIQDYYIQALGRIFRVKESIPIVFDLVDKNPILLKHYKTRKQVYEEHGGIIKNFNKLYPQFFESGKSVKIKVEDEDKPQKRLLRA